MPLATYRVQLNAQQGFEAVSQIAGYLAKLGITHLYASPYLKARPGSAHGYDIVAHDELNPELGGEHGFSAMTEALRRHGLKHIADFVPNHMGVGGADNPLWLDVLEWGRDSRFAGWFDIDWEPNHRYLHGKVLVPFLGDQYGVELEAGYLELRFDAERGEFAVWAYDTHKLPIHPSQYATILGDDTPELEYLGDDFSAIGEWRPQVPRRAGELKEQLAQLVRDDPAARDAITTALLRINGQQPAMPSRPELHELIQQQHWRATHFRVAGDDINYRRFFNINDLAGLRVELPEVFEHQHHLMLQLIRNGDVDGLRIDHIDGLLDPAGYLSRLRAVQGEYAVEKPYLVVEKILSHGEKLPDWPVEGTTGYEFCNQVLGVLLDPEGEVPLRRCYAEFTSETRDFAEMVRIAKLHIMNNEMASELNVLAGEAARVARQTPQTADFTRNVLLRAIRQVVACLSVYRTYLNSGGSSLSLPELAYVQQAFRQARVYEHELDPSVFDFLLRLLSGDLIRERQGFVRHAVLRCAMKFQQYSGPVMAKGQEDTAFYRYACFLALNEVGGDPDRFGCSVEEFHQQNTDRAEHWPHCLLATSTHDTKWGEDARARLAVLSEMPAMWQSQVAEWNGLLQLDSELPLIHLPLTKRRNEIYFIYQLLIATWPAELTAPAGLDSVALEQYVERVCVVMRKVMRETRQGSNWAHPDDEYEDLLLTWVRKILDLQRSAEFFHSFLKFQQRVAEHGINNSLAQTVLKLCSPGVPDLYQGSELWNLSMVDPDNRAAVDFSLRARMLEDIIHVRTRDGSAALRQWLNQWHDGRIKLAIIHALLEFRRAHTSLVKEGAYAPCLLQGPRSGEVVAFTRRNGEEAMLVVVRRFPVRGALREVTDAQWRVPPELHRCQWRDVITGQVHAGGEALSAASLLATLPVAVLYCSLASHSHAQPHNSRAEAAVPSAAWV